MLKKACFITALMTLFAGRSLCAAELTVTFTGIPSEDGVLMIGLYSNAEAFEKASRLYYHPNGFINDRERVIGAAIRLDTGVRVMTFGGLKLSRYAIIAFQDQNRDGKLNRNLFGVPTEPNAFSNNATGFWGLGPPDFDNAAVLINQNRKEITIKMSAD